MFSVITSADASEYIVVYILSINGQDRRQIRNFAVIMKNMKDNRFPYVKAAVTDYCFVGAKRKCTTIITSVGEDVKFTSAAMKKFEEMAVATVMTVCPQVKEESHV